MVSAMINIDDRTNRLLNIVKAKYNLKNKSEAIELVTTKYEQTNLEPELRPEYATKLTKIIKGKHHSKKEIDQLLGD